MKELRLLPTFHQVVLNQSFTRSAAQLGLTRSMVSQHIRALEESLGCQLIQRTTRAMALTPAGEELARSCNKIFSEVDRVTDLIGQQNQIPSGRLRVSAPVDISTGPLAKVMARFRNQYPQVEIDLHLSDQIENLVSSQIDVSIRVGWPKDSAYKATKIADFSPLICANSSYLAQSGRPRDFKDLRRYQWVVLTLLEHPYRWKIRSPNGRSSQLVIPRGLSTNSPAGLKSMVLNGAGFGILPSYQVQQELTDGRLVQLFADHQLKRAGIYALHSFQTHAPPVVRAFIESLKKSWDTVQ